jgi:DNA polymerase-3 subunit delta
LTQQTGREKTKIDDLKPVYLIYGDEQLLLDEAVMRLKNSVAQEADLSFNYGQFFGDKDSVAAVIQAAETLPFMSHKRLVLVKDADKFASSDITVLTKYLGDPSPFTCLVLVAGDVKKTSPLYKAVEKKGQVFEYKLSSKNEYPNWVKKRFRSNGKFITDKAARFLIESVGYNLYRLNSEIEKISLFYTDEAGINEENISNLVCEFSEKNIFDMVDAIGKRDKNNAFLLLKCLMEKGNNPPQLIFFMIVRQFRLLLKTKSLLDRGLTDQAISKELKIPFFVAKKYREQCRNFSLEKLRIIYKLLAEVDLALKTSEREPRLLLEDLLVKIMD